MMQERWVTRLMERFIEWGMGRGFVCCSSV